MGIVPERKYAGYCHGAHENTQCQRTGNKRASYGEGCAMVLDKALEIGKQMGFETENQITAAEVSSCRAGQDRK